MEGSGRGGKAVEVREEKLFKEQRSCKFIATF
jgi:hypothetical protein